MPSTSRPKPAETLRQAAARLMRLLLHTTRRFHADDALNLASSLSYTSLLSLVPLTAIGLAMLAAFPAFNAVRGEIESSVFRNLVPQVGSQVEGYITGFVNNAGQLTAAGIAGLAVTAVMLLVAVESSLNRIFRVAVPRSAGSRLVVYWTALTLGPLLVGVGISISAWFSSGPFGRVVHRWAGGGAIATASHWAAALGPFAVTLLAVTGLYMLIPNRRVRFADALAGGIATAVVTVVLRWGFGLYVSDAHAYQSVYGAMAAIPIFLFWMYLSWAAVLLGAELAAALPEWRRRRLDLGDAPSPRRRLAAALAVLGALFTESRRSAALAGPRGLGRADLAAAADEDERALLDVLDRLQAHGHVVTTESSGPMGFASSERYLLAQDLDAATLADLVIALDLGLAPAGGDEPSPWLRPIDDRVAEAIRCECATLDVPLRAVIEAKEGEPPGREEAAARAST